MSGSEALLWWDRDVDQAGRPIRPDVRAAAHQIWRRASRWAETLISDSSQAADLMENTVAQVSRYLDRGNVPFFSREVVGLILLAFRRAAERRAAKLRRLETVGGSADLASRVIERNWIRQVDLQLDFDRAAAMLSERSRTILSLRYAGYTWNETANLMGASVPALRSAFWRDVGRVKDRMMAPAPARAVDQDEVFSDAPCGSH